MKLAIALFRNDLRLHDNPMLVAAIKSGCTHLLPLFIYDCQFYSEDAKTWHFKFPRLQTHKKRFLLEALGDLKSSLQNMGSDLYIREGNPVEVLKSIVSKDSNAEIWLSKEFNFEEQKLEKTLTSLFKVHLINSASTILKPSDWINVLPDVYTEFRVMVERKRNRSEIIVDDWMRLDKNIPPPPDNIISDKDWIALIQTYSFNKDPRSAFPLMGGETHALERLKSYILSGGLRSYKQTRNGLLGTEYSSKLSPYLAIGCISPKRILAELKDLDSSFDEGSYWLWFELLWRDYFKLVALKYKTKIFMENGLMGNNASQIEWSPDPKDLKFNAWCKGETGVPFVDANMRELFTTGFMSNRGRQNVASFLVKDLNIDWRKGAEWFESHLIDHDVSVNYGNWLYVAGLGNDPRSSRYFNMIKQAKDYDPDGKYVLSWCPELEKAVQNPSLYHTPWKDPRSKYTHPIVLGKGWEKHAYRKDGNKTTGNKREKVRK